MMASLLIATAQGLVIFVTALILAALLKLGGFWWRPLLMIGSWFGWTLLTIVGWSALGGGGLMEGGGLLLVLCATAFVSTLVFTVIWCVVPTFEDNLDDQSER